MRVEKKLSDDVTVIAENGIITLDYFDHHNKMRSLDLSNDMIATINAMASKSHIADLAVVAQNEEPDFTAEEILNQVSSLMVYTGEAMLNINATLVEMHKLTVLLREKV